MQCIFKPADYLKFKLKIFQQFTEFTTAYYYAARLLFKIF